MPFRLDALSNLDWLRQLDYHDQLGSTNDRAIRLAGDPEWPTPSLVLCESQTAGRGRGVNRWWAAAGALTFSLLVDIPPHVPRGRRAWLSLLTGLGVRAALSSFVGQPLQVKWPNDVYLAGRKVCGILIETAASSGGRAVIGIGVNVNNSLAAAPPDVQARAASLSDHLGRSLDITTVLVAVLDEVWNELERIADPELDLPSRWSPHCLLAGKAVRIDAAGRSIMGQCAGIGADGELLVRTPETLERIVAGVVTQIS